jgi:hypothetical protein
MFPDDEDKRTYAAKMLKRVYLDASMSLNPKDFADTIKTPIVAAKKSVEVFDAFWTFLTEGAWGETNQKGSPKGLQTILRSTPGVSGAMQLHDLFSDYNIESDLITTTR